MATSSSNKKKMFITSLVSQGGLLGLPHHVLGVAADEEGHVQARPRALLHRRQEPRRHLHACTTVQMVQDRPLTATIMFSNQQGIPGVDHCSYQRTMQPESHSPEQESSPPSCTRRRSPGSSTASGPTTARRRRAWLPAAPGGSRRPPGPARPPTGRAWSAPRSAPGCLHPQRRNNSVFGRFRVQKFRVWHGHGGARQNYAQQSVRIEPSQLWVAVNSGGSGMSASDTSCQHWIHMSETEM